MKRAQPQKPLRVAVAIAAYNEEKTIATILDALLAQTYPVEQIVVTNDGSMDRTGEILTKYAAKHPCITHISQENAGPANARNRSWRAVPKDTDIIAITDGNCIPEPDWIEQLIKPFSDPKVGATGGAYKTLNPENLLARFFGMEIDYRYSKIKGEIDAHGTYNLAIRRSVLEEVGGFNEKYRKPSGEDWDLTYKISRNHKIMFVPDAVVGTHHPESLKTYLRTQKRRAFDRILLYNEHPERSSKDNYSGKMVKYQIWFSGLLVPSLVFALPIFPLSWLIPAGIFLFILATAFTTFPYYFSRDKAVAVFSVPVQLLRNYAWFIGMTQGLFKFGFIRIVVGVIKSGM